ncbi:amidase domain-containing protein [Streptomyces asoensis]|uniref:amidase domain-containing protein n=1 Tax=Streptomyces TaxID=1883 RepID=UPI00190CE540|nr:MULTISPECIES: amidase domain-containing protein [unclassified Streptomyces]MBK3628505.1 amidase domain-containing protein [Streptomyces sp. MBT49]MBK3631857.1 amidase domain-containing protein [Streptomyces sp. MBT97]
MKSRKLKPTRRRAAILGAAATSVVAGVALLPNWSAGAAVVNDPTVDAQTKATFQRLADAVFTDRTDALVTGKQGDRSKPLTDGFSGDVKLSSGTARTEDSALSTLGARKDKLAKAGEKYNKATTTVTLDATRVTGRTAKAAVTETTTLTYAQSRGDAPKTTGFQAKHELTFKADRQGNWQLTTIKDTDQGGLAVNALTKPVPVKTATTTADDTMPNAARAATTRNPVAVPKTGTAYDYKAMAAYAEKYVYSYNKDYPDFNNHTAGGDCTNFVSQSLKAGGWKHVPGYVYDYTKWFGNADIQSDSFVGVNEWSWFAQNSKRTTALANVYQLEVGDVLQMDFDRDGSKDHTMIVTAKSGGVPYVTYHSNNTLRRSVASLVSSYPTAYFYAYRT